MPNSFSSKPGFYDDSDTPTTESGKKPPESSKPTQEAKKNGGPNDNAKRLEIFIDFVQFYTNAYYFFR